MFTVLGAVGKMTLLVFLTFRESLFVINQLLIFSSSLFILQMVTLMYSMYSYYIVCYVNIEPKIETETET